MKNDFEMQMRRQTEKPHTQIVTRRAGLKWEGMTPSCPLIVAKSTQSERAAVLCVALRFWGTTKNHVDIYKDGEGQWSATFNK